MAYVDYGALLRINGKIVNKNEMFMNMERAVGFRLEKVEDKEWGDHEVNGNYFVYFGDKELLVCIYKTQAVFITENKVTKHFSINYDMPNTFKYDVNINGKTITIKKMDDSPKAFIRFWYKGNLYECMFGYGIDTNKRVYSKIKHNEYGYTNKTIRKIDKWWKED